MSNRLQEAKKLAAGPVLLTQDGVNASRKKCAAGTVIAPHVEGWPEHRVVSHLLQGLAVPVVVKEEKQVKSEKPAKADKPADAKAEKLI